MVMRHSVRGVVGTRRHECAVKSDTRHRGAEFAAIRLKGRDVHGDEREAAVLEDQQGRSRIPLGRIAFMNGQAAAFSEADDLAAVVEREYVRAVLAVAGLKDARAGLLVGIERRGVERRRGEGRRSGPATPSRVRSAQSAPGSAGPPAWAGT